MSRFILIILIGILSFSSNWILSVYQGAPVPYIHDEFSYLLAADTFAHGRVTNPTHPMWQHFETYQVLQQPTYMSKYPPAQGFFMAVGQVLLGHPIDGVWLSVALMCMAICWMLYAWVPAFWAFMGGVIAILQFGMFTYWSQSYWGGAVAALGGALVFGALPRIFISQRLRDVIWLGLGLAILINSRPLEGLFMAIPVGCLVLPWKVQWEKIKNFNFVKKVIAPLVLILFVIVIGMGAYNKAVTGRVDTFPYVLYLKTRMDLPLFVWEPLRSISVYPHEIFRHFEKYYTDGYYLFKRTIKGAFECEVSDISKIFLFYFGYILAIPTVFLFLGFLGDVRRAIKFFLAAIVLCCTCAAMPSAAEPHYFAPITCLAVLGVVSGLKFLVGLFKQKAMLAVYLLIVLQVATNILIYVKPSSEESYAILRDGKDTVHPEYTREEFKNMLMQMGGKHLVLLYDVPLWVLLNDWVYNAADIDSQPIVWARDMGEAKNAELLSYYKNRHVWKVAREREVRYYPYIR